MSRTIREIARSGEPVLAAELAEKAQEVVEDLVKLANEAPDQIDVEDLVEKQQLSPAIKKILSLTARIEVETQDAEDTDDEGVQSRKRLLAAGLSGRIKTLRSAYSMLTEEVQANYLDDDPLTSDMNEVTFRTIIVKELHRFGCGPATFGAETTDIPSFPLHGAILDPKEHSRDIFSVIVSFKGTSKRFPFFVDTGGTECYANRPTLQKIKPGIDLTTWTAATSLRVEVHGVDVNLYLGQPKNATHEMNLLGTRWMEKAELALVCDYSRNGRGCALVKGDDQRVTSGSLLQDLTLIS